MLHLPHLWSLIYGLAQLTLTFETLSPYIPSTGINQYTTTPELE